MAKNQNARTISRRKLARQQTQQKGIPLSVWVIGGGVVLVLLVAVLFYMGLQNQGTPTGNIEGLVTLSAPSREHVSGDVNYGEPIPSGGPHNPEWLNCGIYNEPVRPENAVHSMEHGAVWLAYQPDLPVDQVETLRNIVRNERSRLGEPLIILSPQPDLTTPIVAAAWRVRLELENAQDERLPLFLARYQRGTYTPEPNANCTFGGVGEPLS